MQSPLQSSYISGSQPSSPADSSYSADSLLTVSSTSSTSRSVIHHHRGSPKTASSKVRVVHPYARLHAKREEGKRRKIWNHALEKALFTPLEISTSGAPHRRTTYISSLEYHIDRLHEQLLRIGYWPVPLEDLEPLKGLNSKTAKSVVAGLQHDVSQAKLKLLELERANDSLTQTLNQNM